MATAVKKAIPPVVRAARAGLVIVVAMEAADELVAARRRARRAFSDWTARFERNERRRARRSELALLSRYLRPR